MLLGRYLPIDDKQYDVNNPHPYILTIHIPTYHLPYSARRVQDDSGCGPHIGSLVTAARVALVMHELTCCPQIGQD